MNQDVFDEEMAVNRQTYESLREKIRREYAGQYVAIAFGRVIAVSPDFHDAQAVVDKLKPQPEHAVIFPADAEPAWDVVDSLSTEYM